VALHAGLMMSYHACMNLNAAELGIRRKSILMRRSIPPRSESPSPEGGTASRLRRWIRAVLQTPAPASIDARELSSWRPFSPRFCRGLRPAVGLDPIWGLQDTGYHHAAQNKGRPMSLSRDL
jgi:hypothetical protein